jgi:hypothetical protein
MWKYIASLVLLCLLYTGTPVWAVEQIVGAPVTAIVLASGVTTNTTSAVSKIPAGLKTLYGEVVGTGAITQTQDIYGTGYPTAVNGILLCTITLSGTTRAQDACPPMSANFNFYYVVTTSTTGTGATGAVYAMH